MDSCRYIANKLGIDLSLDSACICDDDNDIEMALACTKAYIPALTSGSMQQAIQDNPDKFIPTMQDDSSSTPTLATDEALRLIQSSVYQR